MDPITEEDQLVAEAWEVAVGWRHLTIEHDGTADDARAVEVLHAHTSKRRRTHSTIIKSRTYTVAVAGACGEAEIDRLADFAATLDPGDWRIRLSAR